MKEQRTKHVGVATADCFTDCSCWQKVFLHTFGENVESWKRIDHPSLKLSEPDFVYSHGLLSSFELLAVSMMQLVGMNGEGGHCHCIPKPNIYLSEAHLNAPQW